MAETSILQDRIGECKDNDYMSFIMRFATTKELVYFVSQSPIHLECRDDAEKETYIEAMQMSIDEIEKGVKH